MNGPQKYHAIRVDPDRCIGCTHCMQVCPTEAIRVRDGLAVINGERCVDCGNCMRACPVEAFHIIQDDLSLMKKFKYRVALFPSVMIGQFPEQVTDHQIYGALLELGFTHLMEVEQPIHWIVEAYRKFHVENPQLRPLISSFCPAIVRLIQIRYPSLIDNIVMVKAPHDLAAHYAMEKLKLEGAGEGETGLFYITPCSAKIVAVKRPLGEKESIVDGILNMDEMYNRVMQVISANPGVGQEGFREYLTREGILWPLPRGEARLFKHKSMAIDGIHNVVKMLERLETENVPELEFLELRSCDQGCAGGILLSGNRFLNVERLERRARNYPHCHENSPDGPEKEEILRRMVTEPIAPARVFQLDEDRARTIEKMALVDKILCRLPAIDCAACGAPNCHALAEDIVMGQAKMTDCFFLQMQWQKEAKVTPGRGFRNMEKIWGKGRFQADCKKKGARNEGY